MTSACMVGTKVGKLQPTCTSMPMATMYTSQQVKNIVSVAMKCTSTEWACMCMCLCLRWVLTSVFSGAPNSKWLTQGLGWSTTQQRTYSTFLRDTTRLMTFPLFCVRMLFSPSLLFSASAFLQDMVCLSMHPEGRLVASGQTDPKVMTPMPPPYF